MAIVRRGKNKGKEVTLMQWCNDWFSVSDGSTTKIYGPTALFFTKEEIDIVFASKELGTMLYQFSYHFDGKNHFFRRQK